MLKAESVVVRTPFYTFDPVNRWEAFREAIRTPTFKEALFLASPDLCSELIKSGEIISNETQLSLYKYFLRMSFRCTPFGMFSGVSAGTTGTASSFQLRSQNDYYKHTRLDNHFVNCFIQKIAKDEALGGEVLWFANNTIYSDGHDIRYVEYRLTADQRNHHLAKVGESEYLRKILTVASTGAPRSQLIESIICDDVSEDEATEFVNELIDSKLLLSELEPTVTGGEPGKLLLKVLEKYESGKPHAEFLKSLINSIDHIDMQGIGTDLDMYNSVAKTILGWEKDFDRKFIFQSDLSKPVEQMQVGKDILDELTKVIHFLAKLNQRSEAPHVTAFREAFSARFEDAEVPLLAVLDTESGLGYPVNVPSGSDQSPVLQGIAFPNKPGASEHRVTSWQRRLMHLYLDCVQQGKMEIVLTDEAFDIKDKEVDEESLADSLYTTCSIIGSPEDVTNGKFLIDFRGGSGPSAANLLGRFCYAHPEIHEITTKLINDEEHLHAEKIYAEIVHLAHARMGNVLLRPSFREYEIPILTFPGVSNENSIPLGDLMVSVRNNKVILRSKKLNKEVVPRNSNAHNYTLNTIPHYHFLCDLQNQEMTLKLLWDWGVLNEFKFLPRIRYGKTILSKARWVLEDKDLALPAKYSDREFDEALKRFATSRHLPGRLTLSQGDNQLPLDLDDAMCVSILRQELKRSGLVMLHECLFNSDTLAVRGPEGGFTNEFIIPWTKTSTAPVISKNLSPGIPVQQNFFPGSEWHYIKIYCGTRTSDKILAEVIKPLTDELRSGQIISQWFFLRYYDPDLHLRLRFRGQGDFFQVVTKRLNEMLAHYVQRGHVWKIQADTYKRELDRYGYENVEASELLFFHDSSAVAAVLQLLDGDEGENIRWQFAIKGINDLLNDFGFSPAAKGEIITILRDRFAFEFNAVHRDSQKLLSDQYRKFRKDVEFALQPRIDEDHDFAPVWKIFEQRSLLLEPVVRQIKEHCLKHTDLTLANLVGSYLHMFVNRFMRSGQRMHELVYYDFLCQYYKSETARARKTRQAESASETIAA